MLDSIRLTEPMIIGDIGFAELLLIAFVGVVLVGPERMPELARQAGRFLRQLRLMATSTRDQIRSELGPEYSDLELRDLDPRQIVRKHVLEAMREAELEAERENGSGAATDTDAAAAVLGDGEVPPYDHEAT